MKQTKLEPFAVTAYQYKGVEQWLNEQAAKGWELTSLGPLFAKFRRTERADLRYCTDLAADSWDEQGEYLDLCRDGGWELVEKSGRMGVFASLPGTDPAPIQTDPGLERENVRRVRRREWLSSLAALAFSALMLGVAFLLARDTESNTLGTQARVMLAAGWLHDWSYAGLLPAVPPVCAGAALWLICRLYRLAVRGRGAMAALTPRVRWAGFAAQALIYLGVVIFLAGSVLDTAVTGDRAPYTVALFIVCGIAVLWAALMNGRKADRGARIRAAVFGAALILLGIGLGVRAAYAIGEDHTWTFTVFDDDQEAELAARAELPIVLEEDLGLEMNHPILRWGNGPVGDYLRYESDGISAGALGDRLSCERYDCRSRWLAEQTAAGLIRETAIPLTDRDYSTGERRLVQIYGGAALEPVELDWADGAWLGQADDGGGKAIWVLVIRAGKLAARVSSTVDLSAPENLQIVRAKLGL